MKQENRNEAQRSIFLMALAVLLVLGYVARLFYLQILSPEYKSKAENNAFYHHVIYPERGAIFDRTGKLLVYNEPAYDVMVITKEVGENLDSLALCKLLSIDIETLRQRFEAVRNRDLNPGYSPYTPQRLLAQVSAGDAGRFQEVLYKFPGFSVQHRSIRRYGTEVAAHVLGYLSECSPGDLEQDSLLAPGDYVGKSGVERTYDAALRGTKGYEVMLRDARGRIQGRYNNGANDRKEVAGRNLTLSIDEGLQALGERMMQGKRGGIVMIEPATGEVLCLVTSPAYPPSFLAGRNIGKNHLLLAYNPGKPLFNRALQGTYPPGSTFKPTQAAILLNEGVITPQTLYTCYRGYPYMRGRPACHGHGSPLAVEFALTTSCNAFFAWGLHYMLDDRRRYPTVQEAFTHWKDYMVRMGYGYPLGIDLPGEKRGFIPNSEYYDKWYKAGWNSSTIISNSIGQGEVLATPLQMANLAAIVANRGYYYRPHVVHEIEGMSLDTAYSHKQYTGIAAQHWEIVANGMAEAVRAGTCHAANFAPGEIEVCGKTGTAENPHGPDHSAFIGFAPRNNPQVAIAVYVENGGFGATYGVPIGRVMLEYYLREGHLSPAAEGIASRMSHSYLSYRNAP